MAERVKQHYVPQFYFRNFAEDERICAYNLDNNEGYPPTPISNICYENHFYGDSSEEKIISNLENKLARVIHTMVSDQSFDSVNFNNESLDLLLLFISHTYARTKAAREESSALTQKFLEIITETGVEADEVDQDMLEKVKNGEVRLKGPDHEQRQLMSFFGPVYFSDLHRILIRNNTDTNFITSDHPVVFDNRRFKDEIELGTTGYSSPGLQVFLPLSNDLLVLLYDPEAYAVDAGDEGTVDVTSENVIVGLNKLQLINCLENCYYRDESDKEFVGRWCQDVKDKRPDEFLTREEVDVYDERKDRVRHLITTFSTKVDYSPRLPFIKQRCSAEYRPVRHLRIHQAAERLYDDVIEQAEKKLEENKEN